MQRVCHSDTFRVRRSLIDRCCIEHFTAAFIQQNIATICVLDATTMAYDSLRP